MHTKHVTLIISIIVVIAISWFFLDHRSGYPKSPEELMPVATSTTATSTITSSSTSLTATVNTNNNQNNSTIKNFMHTITIETSKGTIVFETYDADAPNTVKNFISLANKGFYNGLIFHRVIQGFMIQGGDPTGTGTGGPGYKFADELNPNTDSYKAGYVRGTVAMANAGPNTNGSQFFIMQGNGGLEHKYSIFGKVISGMNVVDAIASVPTNGHPPTGSDRPLSDVKMLKVTVAENK